MTIHATDCRTSGLFGFLAPVLAAGIRRQVRADHRRLKAILEHPAPGPAASPDR